MAPKTPPKAINPKAAPPPPPPAEEPKADASAPATRIRGTFCALEKFGGTGWGLKIEENGDLCKGMEVEVKKRDQGVKIVTINEFLYEDDYKVVCTFIADPNDKPANGRQGSVRKGKDSDLGSDGGEGRGDRAGRGSGRGDLDISSGDRYEDDPRGLRTGRVKWDCETHDLGGVTVAAGRLDHQKLLDRELDD